MADDGTTRLERKILNYMHERGTGVSVRGLNEELTTPSMGIETALENLVSKRYVQRSRDPGIYTLLRKKSTPEAVEHYERLSDAEREADAEWGDFLLHVGAAGSHVEAMIQILTPFMIFKGMPEKLELLERIQADLKKLATPLK